MRKIDFTTVFQNDIQVHHEVYRELFNIFGSNIENGVEVIEGTFKFPFVLSGKLTTKVTHNNTVCGYEPTEFEDVEIHLQKGDKITWIEGSPEYFEHVIIERN